jgi:hypothetical protein
MNDDLLDDEYYYELWLKERAELAQFENIFLLTNTYPI